MMPSRNRLYSLSFVLCALAAQTTSAWFLTSVQAGFELWKGGAGAAGTTFGVSVN